jgi:hypothetical protein
MAAAVLTPVDLQVTKTVLAQAVSDDPASVASRAGIGLRLNGRTQRRASSCQTSHSPESTASPLLAPRVSPSLAPIRPAVDHTSFAGIWAWLSRQNDATNSEKHGPLLLRTKPRISPENPRSFAGGASHGFRRIVLGLGRLFHTYRCVGSVACIGPMARSESSD